MPLLRWLPEYSVNETELDDSHKKLFYILNSTYEKIMNSQEVDSALPVIVELSEYTKHHFLQEEHYMREKGYCEIEAHIAEHKEFADKIEALKTHCHGNNLEITQELIVVLGGWLLHHVIKEDIKYSKA